MNYNTCVQVYTRNNLLSKITNVAWSTGTYQGNRKRSLMGHELFAQVRTVLQIFLVMSSVFPGAVLAHVETSPWEGGRVNRRVD